MTPRLHVAWHPASTNFFVVHNLMFIFYGFKSLGTKFRRTVYYDIFMALLTFLLKVIVTKVLGTILGD